jgi:hypothetical protein
VFTLVSLPACVCRASCPGLCFLGPESDFVLKSSSRACAIVHGWFLMPVSAVAGATVALRFKPLVCVWNSGALCD